MLPNSLKNLIDHFSKLPGIGQRAATRLVFFLLNQPPQDLKDFAQSIIELKTKTKICQNCFNLSSETLCAICSDKKRNPLIICVVEDILDIIPLERTHQFNGLYHVLGGLISPTEGLTPEKLKIKELVARIKKHPEQVEVILAFNPTVEGDATALYLERILKPLGAKITRLARGLSAGGDLEYTDEATLINALKNRH
ncbi:MAG: recombination protein RecR [Parcubacteria group bacterium CG1_02_40_82]|uniref:Recombination protein RecR n=4 Tax=Candidatus Portnoyibacteriota TaxID=1817913 RepID=A0A2M7IIW7_9BACT|nr:MAG: recombination protein RecR [Parcubacteria group bacterium CG1_02_40_82]PIQ75243.1 MAG: recombination protein RecR [Candidatus Portnoybacteria bacterium CG11_big_fil_rev_8_21_14_0_20_40_15]PIS31887.1 MAG: recombination protein RecR [Candidatus Portnoybacteria bacterium CG08_land_8_20_14_0_20_40_83]PIW76442.1 MAG: recombination protein RecR [Candidatus Portnoybacteria bacterium CG_4_8_14_3_um_filter_40_10]PIY74592.1 MAG: recombination protein RecR [Candidatus Portnoybacteria bacterium CG_